MGDGDNQQMSIHAPHVTLQPLHLPQHMPEEMDLGAQVFGIAQLAFVLEKGMNERPEMHQGNER